MIRELLEQITDPQGRQGRDYKLWSILCLIVVGFLCGRRGLLSICEMGKAMTKEQQRALGFKRGMPCHATLTETIRYIDADEMATIFGRATFVRNDAAHHLSIDGKTMRASKDGEGKAIHCVAAFCHGLQQVINHTASRGKGLEIPEALALLDKIALKDKVVTADALLCQKSIAAKIVDKGGDYVLPVKDNQRKLRESIQTAFDEPVFPPAPWGRTGT